MRNSEFFKFNTKLFMVVVLLIVVIYKMFTAQYNHIRNSQEYTAKCASLKGVAYIQNDTYKCYVNGVDTKIN